MAVVGRMAREDWQASNSLMSLLQRIYIYIACRKQAKNTISANLSRKAPTNMKRFLFLFALLLVAFTNACERNITRSEDGSLRVETSITAQALQEAIQAAIADPLIKEINVSLQPGYILVSGQRERLNDSSKTDTLSFRLNLGVNDGQLTAVVSQTALDGKPLDQARIDHWNETIADRLQKMGQNRANTTLQSVTITPEGVQMTWQVSRK